MNFKQLFSIPNLLCYFRIGMIPVFAYTYLQAETSADYLSSALILGIMEFTDFLDGFIARKYHMVTEAGKIIDPIADKLLQLTLLLLIVIRNPFAAVVLILFLIKEASMAVCGLVSIKRKCRLDGRTVVRKSIHGRVLYLHGPAHPLPKDRSHRGKHPAVHHRRVPVIFLHHLYEDVLPYAEKRKRQPSGSSMILAVFLC